MLIKNAKILVGKSFLEGDIRFGKTIEAVGKLEGETDLDAQGGYEEIASLDQDGAAPEETQPLVLAEGEPAEQDSAGEAGTESGEAAARPRVAGIPAAA